MKTKKLIAIVVVAVLALGLVSACANGGGSSGSKVSIEWWSLWDPDLADEVISDFEDAYPNIEVIRTQHGDPGIWEAMVVATATRSGPDMFFNWSGPYQESFYRKGGTISLNDYVNQYGWGDRLLPAATSHVTFDGHLTLIPYAFNAVGIVYKKATFEQFGISEPTSYAELTAVCNTFVENGILPYSIGGIDTWHTMGWVDAVLEQFCGPAMHDKLNDVNDTSVSWDSPEVIAAFQELSEWIDRGWVDPNFAGVAEAESHIPIYNGTAAMNVTGDWSEFNIREAGFDSADFGFFPYPRDGGEGRLVSFVAGLALCDFNSEEATDAAAEFLDFILKPESVDKYIPMMGSLSGVRNAPIDDTAHILKIVDGFMKTRDSFAPADGILPEESVDVFLSLCAQIISGQVSPEDAARRMQDSMESARANMN